MERFGEKDSESLNAGKKRENLTVVWCNLQNKNRNNVLLYGIDNPVL
jgi:hypothetical protein